MHVMRQTMKDTVAVRGLNPCQARIVSGFAQMHVEYVLNTQNHVSSFLLYFIGFIHGFAWDMFVFVKEM